MRGENNLNIKERQWLTRHLAGDKNAFAELMSAYRKPVYSYLVRCGFDKSTRDDLFQDVFFKIHKSASSYKKSQALSPWIFTIAINTVRNHIRDTKSNDKSLSLQTAEIKALYLVDPAPTPEQKSETTHTLQWMVTAIQSLPQAQSEALNLTVIEGMKLSDAAKILNLPLSTLKTQVRRARQSLICSFKNKECSTPKRSLS